MGPEESDIVLIFTVSATLIVLLAIAVVLFVLIYQKRMVDRDVELQKLKNKRQHELLRATIQGAERERKRLAQELHDGVGSQFSGLQLTLAYRAHHPETSADQAAFLDEACAMIGEGLEGIRRVSHNLLPSTLEEFGLIQALQDCIAPVQKAGFTPALEVKGTPFRPGTQVELGLLRAMQELLNNTIKHANATQVHICLTFDPYSISIRYSDNGVGLSQKLPHSGIGLMNIQSRVGALGGTVSFEGSQGFVAKINVPLQAPNSSVS
ncbi:MAG: sensor histidine kinase [Salibacteraceae bacterium]